jgi:hypothetical protein
MGDGIASRVKGATEPRKRSNFLYVSNVLEYDY